MTFLDLRQQTGNRWSFAQVKYKRLIERISKCSEVSTLFREGSKKKIKKGKKENCWQKQLLSFHQAITSVLSGVVFICLVQCDLTRP